MNTQLEHFDEAEIFLCDCSDVSHQIVFQLWDWGDKELDYCELNLHVHLHDWPGFWKRVGLGLRYIFGYKSRFGHYDTMSIRYQDVPRIKAVLDKFTQKVDKYNEADNSTSERNKGQNGSGVE